MHATLKLRKSDPHDDFGIAPDVVPASWADKVVADIARDANSHVKSYSRRPASDRPPLAESGAAAGAVVPKVDTTFRATAVDDVSNSHVPDIDVANDRPAGAPPSRSRSEKNNHGVPVCAVQRVRRCRLATLRCCRKADDRGLDAFDRPHRIAADGKDRFDRAIRCARRRGRRGGSVRAARPNHGSAHRRSSPSRRALARCRAVAVDGARPCRDGSADRAAQGQPRRTQGEPAGHGDRQTCRGKACRGEAVRGQTFGSKSAAKDISATAATDRGAQADTGLLSTRASRRTVAATASTSGVTTACATTASSDGSGWRTRGAAADAAALECEGPIHEVLSSPPSTRIARGGEGSGLGAARRLPKPRFLPIDPPPPTPPHRFAGGGEKMTLILEARVGVYHRAALRADPLARLEACRQLTCLQAPAARTSCSATGRHRPRSQHR